MEMTALAGTIGRHLAAASGSPPAVADAVYESVLPRNAGDATPTSPAGILVAVTDRWVLIRYWARCRPRMTISKSCESLLPTQRRRRHSIVSSRHPGGRRDRRVACARLGGWI